MTEQATPDQVESDLTVAEDGDFGKGMATLEQQLLDSLPQEGAEPPETPSSKTAEVESDKTVEPAPASGTAPTSLSLFDLNGKVSLKIGDKVTPDHIKELERGWLREADYTRKTQDLAKIRKESEETLQAQKDIQTDPRNLFKYIAPQHILSAFTRQEMLSHGLHAGGVTPQVWNRFLDWYQENEGEEATGKGEAAPPKADPYGQQLSEFSRRIEAMEREHLSLSEQRKADAEQSAYNEQMNVYDREVEAALKDFPAVNKRALLVEMAASDGAKTIRELAEELNSALETRFQEYLKTKQTQKQQATVKTPRGTAIPVMQKRPATFEEADEAIAKMYGDGSLRGGVPFGG